MNAFLKEKVMKSKNTLLAIFAILWLADPICSRAADHTNSQMPARKDLNVVYPTGGALSGERYRVIIGTDLGRGDYDDTQSLVHFLLYADLFDIEGIIATTGNGGTGKTSAILNVIDAYAGDYDKLKTYSERYPTPTYLRSIVVKGQTKKAPPAGYTQPTAGSKLIIAAAQKKDPRPLYICFWGGVTDLAQAVHDNPNVVKTKVRGIAIDTMVQDRHAGRYLTTAHQDLWLVRIDGGFRGMWKGGTMDGHYGNRSFVAAHIRDHGSLGNFYWNIKRQKDGTYPRTIREGDTPSFLYLLRGDPNDPTQEHWGGQYRKSALNQWIDLPNDEYSERSQRGQIWHGCKTISKWRTHFLDEYERRMDRAQTANPKRMVGKIE